MPRTILLQTAFSTGEITPRLYGRQDLAKYQQGASCVRNYIVMPQGGVTRRPGTHFVKEVDCSAKITRLLPFEFSTTQAYILELGCTSLRFYRNGAIIGTSELATNGTFDSDLSTWNTSAVTWDSGMAKFDPSAGATINKTITVPLGQTITFTLRVVSSAATHFRAQAGSTVSGTDYVFVSGLSAGTYTYTFTSITTTLYIAFAYFGSGTAGYLDDVSVRVSALKVVTPLSDSQVFDVDTLQVADVLYVFHPSVPPAKLLRYGDACWRYVNVNFSPPPTREYGARPGAEIQVSAVSGANVTVTAFNCDAFLFADCGREIVVTGGNNAGARGGIKGFNSSRSVVINVCEAWGSTSVDCRGNWIINGSPLSKVTPGAKSPVGQNTILTASACAWRTVTQFASCGSDVGRFVTLNGGQYQITDVTSCTVAKAVIMGEANASTVAQAGAWTLEEPMSCSLGYPETGTLHQDRLYTAQSYFLTGSKVSDYENYGVGILDDDAVIFAVNTSSGQVNRIRWLRGAKNLLIGTSAGELVAVGGNQSPITPTNIQIDAQTNYGSNGVPPVKVSNTVLFPTRSGKRLREYVYSYEVDQWVAPDLLLLAEHLTRDAGIVDIAIQREPEMRVWAVRSDGVLLCCTYLRDQQVVAWSHHVTGRAQDTSDGKFESVAVIPHPDGDREQVWVVVNRTLNGTTKRYVEYLDDSCVYYRQRHLDSSLTYTGAPCAFFTGLNHLECQTVRVVVGGNDCGSFVVVNGQIGGWTAGTPIEVGLDMTSRVTTLEPAIDLGGQAVKAMRKRLSRLYAVVDETVGLTISTTCGPNVSPAWRRPGIDTGATPPPLRSGLFEVTSGGPWNDGRVTVTQSDPYPSTILEVGAIFDIGDA